MKQNTRLNKTVSIRRAQWLLAAVVAALPAVIMPGGAAAQQQQPVGGRALDANNRIGSGGTNTYRPAPSVGVYGNQVVNGNVTGGAQFHGNVGYSDPNEFRGFQAGRVTDNFVRDSAGVGVSNAPPPVPNGKEAYYAESRFAPPAQPGYVQAKNQPGFMASQPIIVQPNDARLGAQLDASPTGTLPRPGELILPGPVDATSNAMTFLTAGALTGIRPVGPTDAMSQMQLGRVDMNFKDVLRMRDELRSGPQLPTGELTNRGQLNTGSVTDATGAPLKSIGQAQAQPMQALENPNNPNLSASPLATAFTANPISGNLTTDQAYSNKVLGAPQQQSTQYDELKKRLERFRTDRRESGEVANAAFNDAMKKKEADAQKAAAKAADAANPNGTKPGVLPGGAKATPGTASGIKEPVKPAPTVVKHFGEGMQSKGLKELLDKAESMMKEGKFTSAIDQYAAAEAVAPNQPLVWVGRANAELGAAYYNRAEAHLKQAFGADQALLMAQYDLRGSLGEERLQSVIKDLKDIASTDQQSPTPVFLLAYIAYNTGNERRAAGYLDLAEKRAGGKDASYKLLREHWSLPTAQETTPEGKGADTKVPDISK